MRLRPTRNAKANAAPPTRPRNRNAMNAAKANAREAWPLGKEGSNSASHPYPARFRKEVRTSQGRGRPTANLIASVTTTVMPRRTSRSKAASRRPRHQRGTATSPRRYAAPRVVTTIMNASAIGLEPARFSRWKSISSGPSAGIERGSTRRNRSAHIKPAADPEPQVGGPARSVGDRGRSDPDPPEACARRGPLPHEASEAEGVLPSPARAIRRRPRDVLRSPGGGDPRGPPRPGGRRTGDRGLDPPLHRGPSGLRRGRVHGADRTADRLVRLGRLRDGPAAVREAPAPGPRRVPGVPRAARRPREGGVPAEAAMRRMPRADPVRVRPPTDAGPRPHD